MSEPSWCISMSSTPQDFRIFASENPRIGGAGAEKHYPELVRWKTAYDFSRGQILRIRVCFIRERWSEYRNHQDFCGLHPGFVNA